MDHFPDTLFYITNVSSLMPVDIDIHSKNESSYSSYLSNTFVQKYKKPLNSDAFL